MSRRTIPALLETAADFYKTQIAPAEDHSPHTFIIRCVDSRLLATKLFNLNVNEALIHTTVGGLVPPQDRAGDNFLAQLDFVKLKQIRNIVILVHGDCGGAHLASKMYKGNEPAENEARIFNWISGAGLPLTKPKSAFGCVALPLAVDTPDKMARMFGVQSLHNLMQYDGIEKAVMKDELDVVLLFKDLKNNKLDSYNVEQKRWVPLIKPHAHFCERRFCGPNQSTPAACGGCAHITGDLLRALDPKVSPALPALQTVSVP